MTLSLCKVDIKLANSLRNVGTWAQFLRTPNIYESSRVVHAYNSRAGEAEAGGSLGFHGQLWNQLISAHQVPVRDPISKNKMKGSRGAGWETPKVNIWPNCSHYTCTLTHMYTHTQKSVTGRGSGCKDPGVAIREEPEG